MNVKLFRLTCVFVLSLLIISPLAVSAQTKQRIVLKKTHGESGAAVAGSVSGTVAGSCFRDFVFRARKNQGMDLNIDTSSGDAVSFRVVQPNGKTLVKDTGDFLDEAPQNGDYTVRVYIVGGKAGSRKKSAFRFSVFMYV